MGKCNIDHTHADVIKKLQSQKEYLPESLVGKVNIFLEQDQPQEKLNDLFHLFKKYDLATVDEQEIRNEKMEVLLK